MRALLRRVANSCAACVPPYLVRVVLKTFSDRPELAARGGFDVVPRVFYSPIPLPEEIDASKLDQVRYLPGIDLRESAALKLLDELIAFAPEIARIPRHRSADCLLWLENGTYADFDAATLYAMLRHLKPKRYVEVGCGFSSRASSLALSRNEADGKACQCDYVEPFPSAQFLELKLPGTFHRKKVQEMPLEVFQKLEAGDVLFIDTSHVLKTQSDVEFELLRVLPLLKPGVWVHVHDIFTPYDYPAEWVLGAPRAGNNEQYGLECLLSGGCDWQVELPVHFLWRQQRARLNQLVRGTTNRPAAFWMRKV